MRCGAVSGTHWKGFAIDPVCDLPPMGRLGTLLES